jgi:hypothetical protein
VTGPIEQGTPPTARTERLANTAALVGLAALSVAFFWKIVLTNQILSGIDVFAYFYPYREFASEALRAGRLPLWNPYLFMGAPLLANSQAAVLYPLHWPLIWLSAPKQIAWSIVLHIWLAGAGTFLLTRRVMRLRLLPSLGAAVLFSFGGFLGAQAEHINQLNASAWLPWLLLCLENAASRGRLRWLAFLLGCAVISLILLAGHTQAAYIVLVGAAFYSLLRGWADEHGQGWRGALQVLRGPALLAGMCLAALLLSAGQLLPTLELSRLSVRSGGLPFREAVSFSLKPTQVFKAFLPPFLWEPPLSEFVAYLGFIGLVLASIGAWPLIRRLWLRVRRWRRPASADELPYPCARSAGRFDGPALGLALLGVFLALGAYNPVYYVLYKLVPGIALFRAPARWLLLFAFGAALLASIGLDRIASARRFRGRAGGYVTAGLLLLMLTELFVAGRRLAYNHPTAPAAYDSMRAATAHLLADSTSEPYRFLSMSDTLYDPGDLADLEAMFQTSLSQDAIYRLVVATKMKEVLAFNLPLHYGIFSVDGYDGGLLPTARYVTFEHLFLPAGGIWPDGRLRQQLQAIPPERLLSLLNVRYVITDKMQDIWRNGVYYDLEHRVPLGELELTDLPDFEATQLGVVTYLTGTAGLPNGTPVAEIVIEASDQTAFTTTLRAGHDTAEGLYDTSVAHQRASVVHHWRENGSGNDYLAMYNLEQAVSPSRIVVRSLLPREGAAQVVLRGLSLVDSRTGTSRSISIIPTLPLVHSGDVKVYENLAVLPRTFFVHEARVTPSDAQALQWLSDPAFDPSREVVLSSEPASPRGTQAPLQATEGLSDTQVIRYNQEQVLIRSSQKYPGYLVLTDAYYPGWKATVDGTPVPILRGDIYFRAIALDAGDHTIAFQYSPPAASWGFSLGGAWWLAWALAVAVAAWRAGRGRQSRV